MDEGTYGLIGVVVGAIATIGTTAWLENRRAAKEAGAEKRELIAAIRLVLTDFQIAQEFYRNALNDGVYWDAEIEIPHRGWDRNKGLLAKSLTDAKDWQLIAKAAMEVGKMNRVVRKNPNKSLDDTRRKAIESRKTTTEAAIAFLEKEMATLQ